MQGAFFGCAPSERRSIALRKSRSAAGIYCQPKGARHAQGVVLGICAGRDEVLSQTPSQLISAVAVRHSPLPATTLINHNCAGACHALGSPRLETRCAAFPLNAAIDNAQRESSLIGRRRAPQPFNIPAQISSLGRRLFIDGRRGPAFDIVRGRAWSLCPNY